MATSRSRYAACRLVEDSILELEAEAGSEPVYNGVVVTEDTLLVIDEIACNLQLYSRRASKLLDASHRLESYPRGVCLISKTEVAVCLVDSKIVILSLQSVHEVKRVRTLKVRTGFNVCHSVAKLNSDKLVVSGWKLDDCMLYWCVVNLTDGGVDSTHKICKGGLGSPSHLAIKDNTIYISCWTYDSTTEGVYAYDIFNPHSHKFLYQHHRLTPGSVMVDRRNFIFVFDRDSNSIHQLRDSGQLVTIHTVSSRPHEIFYDDQHGVLYTTIIRSNVITVYRLDYLHQPGIPVEILNMDDKSIQLFEEALKDGKERVYSIRIMVVGHFGVGKTTLVKRLLGEEVNISERCSTEGIDVYVNCCDVSLSTHEWTRRTKDSEQDCRLQRLARILNEQQSMKDKSIREEQVIIPSQGETTHKGHEVAHNAEVLYIRSPQRDLGQDLSSAASQQVESSPALAQREPIQSETNMTAMLKLLQENVYKLVQDTDKTSPLTMWDFAGQFAFYTTHQTFLTRRAIYLLVSDVSKQLTDLVADECYFDSDGIMKCKVHEMIEVWLNSIHSCTTFPEAGMPPVILVGTHVDKISQKQSPAKRTEPEETQTKKMETVEFTPPTIPKQDSTTTKEHQRTSTFFGAMNKVVKLQKTKGTLGATNVPSMTVPAVDQPKTKKKWKFWPVRTKKKVDAVTEEEDVHTDDYSTPAGVDIGNSQVILKALYDYTDSDPGYLSFSEGEELIFIEIPLKHPGWWKAKNSLGEVGLVPSDYMQRCLAYNLPSIAQDDVHTDDYSTPAGVDIGNSQVILKALYDYTDSDPGYLSFSEGEELIFIEIPLKHPGWWKAKNNLGEVGLVPSDYMQSYSDQQCERHFRRIRSYLRDKPTRFHLVDEDFVINNTIVDPRLQALKRKIIQVASRQPYWGEVIPARWLPLEQELMKLRFAGIKVIPRSLVENLSQTGAVTIPTDELELFLRFQHDIGAILYFSMEVLKEKIVLDPKWMIDALKSLITAEMFVLRTIPAITEKWTDFKESGKLFPELIDALWTKEKYPDFHNNKALILLLMEQMNIIAKPKSWSEDSLEPKEESYFLAPCMLCQKMPVDVISQESDPEMKSSSVLCCVFTGKFLPSPIFHRLLAACITIWPIAKRNMENLIFCGCCVFQIDHTHRLILHFRDYVIFARVTKMSSKDENPDQVVCIQVRMFIDTNLSKIIGCLGSTLQYEWYIQCPQSKGDDVEKVFPVSELEKCKELPCYFHVKGHMVSSGDMLEFWFKDQVKREPIIQDHINHFRLEIALRNICGEALREILLKHVPTGHADIYQAIKAKQAYLTSKRLNKEQCKVVFPGPQDVGKVEDFDISLLYTLIRNVSSIPAPSTKWGEPTIDQPVRDTTLEANVERIRFYRNHISGHSVDGKCSQQEFEDYWKQIEFVLSDIENALGKQGYREKLEKCKNQALPH